MQSEAFERNSSSDFERQKHSLGLAHSISRADTIKREKSIARFVKRIS